MILDIILLNSGTLHIPRHRNFKEPIRNIFSKLNKLYKKLCTLGKKLKKIIVKMIIHLY